MFKLLKNKYFIISLKILIVALLYFLFGKFAFALSVSNGIVTNVPFFAEGIGLSSTILLGNVAALGIFSGQFILAYTSGVSLGASIIISIINSVLAVLGRHVFYRLKLSDNFNKAKDIILLSVIILFVIQPISAILGNLTLYFSGSLERINFFASFATWFLGNSIGQLTMVPLVIFLYKKKFRIKTFVCQDLFIALASFFFTFLLFKITHYIDDSFIYVTLLLLYPITFILATQKNPETIVMALTSITIAAFLSISQNMISLADKTKVETFMRLDLLIISLQLSGMIISVLIYDLKTTQNKLFVTKERLNAIINTTFAGFSVLDSDGRVLFSNPNAETIHGYHPDEILGKHFIQFIQKDDIEIYQKLIKDILAENKRFETSQIRFIHKNSHLSVWISIVATKFIKFDEDLKENVLFVFQDISKQKENELILKELNSTKDKFISILAHDLRNPFNALIGFSELLKESFSNHDFTNLEMFVNIIYQTSKNTYSLLENLLNWANAKKGNMSFNPQFVSLNAIIHDCISIVDSSAKSKQIELINLMNEEIEIKADVEMIKTVVRNLLSNAVKFTNKSGKIEITCRQVHNKLEVMISDNGIGITKEAQQTLFNFGETKSIEGTEGEQGTGLGLLLCKEFIIKHGGNIWVESEEGKGSRFIFSIPYVLNDKTN